MTEGEFRSQNAAAETDTIAAIYAAEIPLEKPGKAAVLAITNVGASSSGPPPASPCGGRIRLSPSANRLRT